MLVVVLVWCRPGCKGKATMEGSCFDITLPGLEVGHKSTILQWLQRVGHRAFPIHFTAMMNGHLKLLKATSKISPTSTSECPHWSPAYASSQLSPLEEHIRCNHTQPLSFLCQNALHLFSRDSSNTCPITELSGYRKTSRKIHSASKIIQLK